MRTMGDRALEAAVVLAVMIAVACGGKKPPVVPAPAPTNAPTPPSTSSAPPETPPPAPQPAAVPEEAGITSTPLGPWADKPLDVINGPESPFKPAFFAFDSDQLDDAARHALDADAAVLKTYPTWVVTIEGHCDERGTAEYNLALGDRRALAAKNYLVTLGIAADRIRTVSYGKEFPFDPGHDEAAWAKNRRAHFMLTSK
jgi:peptidoglycan-associated lipoprotein